jgi:hypothetical protein
MATEKYTEIVKLGDLGEAVADPNQDVRGRKVIDKDGLELGKIDSVLMDDRAEDPIPSSRNRRRSRNR